MHEVNCRKTEMPHRCFESLISSNNFCDTNKLTRKKEFACENQIRGVKDESMQGTC